MTDATKKWRLPMGPYAEMRNNAHARALRIEITPEFPGVDIDEIHYKRGMPRPKQKTTPMQKISRIVQSIRALEPA